MFIRLATLCGAFMFAISSFSSMSIECASSLFGERGYNFGYNLERQLLDDVWYRYGTCLSIDQFVDNSVIETDFQAGTTRYILCRNEGILDSMLDSVEHKQEFCSMECLENGEKAGLIAAAAVCGLQRQSPVVVAKILEKLRNAPSIGLCSVTHTQACQNAFNTFVTENSCHVDELTKQDFVAMACSVRN